MPDVTDAPTAKPERAHTTPVEKRPGATAVRVTAAVALVGVLVAVAGLASAARPLRSPTQDCGTALTYLTQGRVDEFVDPADPPTGATRAEAEANNAHPCQERAADRALPAGIAVVGGTAVALGAAVVEGVLRFRLARSRHQRWLTGTGATEVPALVVDPPPPLR